MFKKRPPPPEGDELKKWSSQIRKGSLEMCLLGVIANRPRYGFEIVQVMSATGGLMVTEGTLYPLLNRLQNENLISAFWQESTSGPPRKYYSLTPQGEESFRRMKEEWRRYAASVETLLLESELPGEASPPVEPLPVAPKPLM